MSVQTTGPTAGALNMIMERGATFSRVFSYVNKQTQAPIPLVGYEARMQARAQQSSPDVLFDFGPYLTVDGAAGKVIMTVPWDVTLDFAWTEAVYDLEVQDGSNGPVTRLLAGRITVLQEVTR